jgi:hypothetical protein
MKARRKGQNAAPYGHDMRLNFVVGILAVFVSAKRVEEQRSWWLISQ